jgi:hypothetical protein
VVEEVVKELVLLLLQAAVEQEDIVHLSQVELKLH